MLWGIYSAFYGEVNVKVKKIKVKQSRLQAYVAQRILAG